MWPCDDTDLSRARYRCWVRARAHDRISDGVQLRALAAMQYPIPLFFTGPKRLSRNALTQQVVLLPVRPLAPFRQPSVCHHRMRVKNQSKETGSNACSGGYVAVDSSGASIAIRKDIPCLQGQRVDDEEEADSCQRSG